MAWIRMIIEAVLTALAPVMIEQFQRPNIAEEIESSPEDIARSRRLIKGKDQFKGFDL